MTSKALKALKKSIIHWRKIAAGNPTEYLGPQNCELCKEFRIVSYSYIKCYGCPVKEKTGKSGCRETPYQNVSDALSFKGRHSSEFLNAAKKELNFLKSLLPVKKHAKRRTKP